MQCDRAASCIFYQYYYQMSKSLKLVIRNSKQHPFSDYPTRRDTLTPLSKPSGPVDLTQRINMLQGNLRMLEKRYRANLKEGFDNKIKAYRLQAVVERKLLKEAIEETQRAHQREQIMGKIEINERQRKLDESRAMIAHFQKEERLKFIKMRNIKEKRSLSLTSHQRKAQLEKQLREAHDKIVEEQANINRKKEYFDFIRRANLKKEELQHKKDILQKIMSNTQRLKDLKYTLQDLRSSDRENTFITM